ncbi:MAG: zf-HC2 domain-containing protein [Candidatus Tectomicrobia bacterium]|nr:zf-HC2 domain-containing protein [Candidatus Tectomicrobia bacterium]
MLSCEQCRKYLGFYLDQALGVKESLEVQEHLQDCQECTDLAAAECSLRAVVRQQAATEPLPEADKRRLIRLAMQEPSHNWSWLEKLRQAVQWRDAVLGAALSAAVLLVFLSPVRDLLSGHDAAHKFVHESALAYQTYLHHDVPMEVETNDDVHLARWANDVVERNFRVPCITDEAAQLVGGRVCRLRDRKGLAMKYRHQGSDLLVFAFRDASLSLPDRRMTPTEAGDFYVRHVSGRPVILWQRAGVTYSLVGDIDHQALLQVAGTVRYLRAMDTGHNVTGTTLPVAPISGQ